jgi:RimJ/RimL family protein N-acetyltransferase
MCITLRTDRLELLPMNAAHVDAVMHERRDELASMLAARLPVGWPGRDVVARAFSSIERIREDPARWLWGDRLVLAVDGPRRVVGSVVFFGAPDESGAVEIAYGIEPGSQGRGYASEATRACVAWALAQTGVRTVTATTPPFHRASERVLEKLGMRRAGTRDHELLGELALWSLRRDSTAPQRQELLAVR